MFEDLIESIHMYEEYHGFLDAIVVEGYDGVGKGAVLRALSDHYKVTPYRPDYNLWQKFDLRKSDRWKISGFFWDIYSHFKCFNGDTLMLFDRGILSGAVYTPDMAIADHYKDIIRDKRILHILVDCYYDSYRLFCLARNPEMREDDIKKEYIMKGKFTELYHEAFARAGAPHLVYMNNFDSNIPTDTCEGCGHYSYGWCRHPIMNCKVDPKNPRCKYSRDKEVQDIGTEMCSM